MDAASKWDELEAGNSPEPAYQLLYISASNHDFTEPELEELLKAARENNLSLGITGMLLYHKGSFIQALEGPKAVVEQLYKTIGTDTRHTETRVLYRGDVPDRNFKNWSMGFFRSSQSSAANLDGFHQFLRTGFRSGSKEDEGLARKALLAFREGKWHAANN
ncbi:hypothetical protein AB833_25270 [Chromatiales bacterium (ex Bugula neritina AB1)]|nr:hypothetical protein AB833_25270 [Chromatiales bacterium (ex Bugula neritina AB1)]